MRQIEKLIENIGKAEGWIVYKTGKTTLQPADQLKHFLCYAFDSGKEGRLQR